MTSPLDPEPAYSAPMGATMTTTCAPTMLDVPDPHAEHGLDHCPAGHPYVCACGEPLTIVRMTAGDYRWADSTGVGSTIGKPGANPVEHAFLARWLRDQKDAWEWLAEHDIALYSALSCAHTLGMWPPRHQHRPIDCIDDEHPVFPLPWCCGWPMQSALEGWRCRVAKTITPYGSAA